jgi:molybdate transport system regulatory protein
MPDQKRTSDILLNYKIWLSTENGQGIMGDGKWKILKAIEEYGSLKAATEALDITYRRTWGDLKKIEDLLGFAVLEKSRGGKTGGHTQLTEKGRLLVGAFDRLHQQVGTTMDEAFRDFHRQLKMLSEE